MLAITFGSLLAAGLPLLTALVSVGTGLAAIIAATGFFDLNSSVPTLALMLGLAVGIDYAVFILSRHRSQLLAGSSRRSRPRARSARPAAPSSSPARP